MHMAAQMQRRHVHSLGLSYKSKEELQGVFIQCGRAVSIASKVCFTRANASHLFFSFPYRAAINFSLFCLAVAGKNM